MYVTGWKTLKALCWSAYQIVQQVCRTLNYAAISWQECERFDFFFFQTYLAERTAWNLIYLPSTMQTIFTLGNKYAYGTIRKHHKLEVTKTWLWRIGQIKAMNYCPPSASIYSTRLPPSRRNGLRFHYSLSYLKSQWSLLSHPDPLKTQEKS